MPRKPTVKIVLIATALSLSNSIASAAEPSPQGMAFFKQAKYAAAANAFSKSYAASHSATDCYYTALSYHYDGKTELARKFYQETADRYPASREAGMARQALVAVRPMAAARIGAKENRQTPPSEPTSQASTNSASPDLVDDLLSKASAAEQANQYSTADAYYSDAIRNAEKLGQTNPKLIAALDQSAHYFARHQRTDKALAAYDRERNLLRSRYGQDSVEFGNNLLAIARMFKNADNCNDAKDNYYQAIDTFSNALHEADNRPGTKSSQARALLAETLDELANHLYNQTYYAKGYGNVQTSAQFTTDLEVSRLRARAEQVRLGN